MCPALPPPHPHFAERQLLQAVWSRMLGLAHLMGTELGDWEAKLIVLSISHSPLA